jgi:hypothetical protein
MIWPCSSAKAIIARPFAAREEEGDMRFVKRGPFDIGADVTHPRPLIKLGGFQRDGHTGSTTTRRKPKNGEIACLQALNRC